MNHLGVTLVTAAVQVTLAMIPAVIVVAVTGRRNPRTAAAFATVSLVLCLGLTATAFAPSPPWRDWLADVGMPSMPPRVQPGARPAPSGSDAAGLGVPIRRLLELLSVSGSVEQEQQTWSAWAWLAIVALAGTGLAALRLTARLWAVAACRARSRPIRDAALRRLVDDLRRDLGCSRDVEVRASGAVGTAATIGWLRPAILLADDWSAWAPDELRAVMAHELAHVRRSDYSAALFASICRALHFYHPLVAWLAGRLRLHQELAADAIAAGAVGGRSAYLVALARMALRQERFHTAGAARPFLSDRNSLLRRIAMLRVTEDRRPLSRGARWGLATVLIGTALAASAVRGTAQAPAQIEATSTQLPPIDLRFVPEKTDGVFVLRPAALLARPEMKPLVDKWNGFVADANRQLGIGATIDISTIEQVVGSFELKTLTDEEVKKYGRPERRSVIMGLAMVRMTRDYDWPEFFKALAPVVETKNVKPGSLECFSPAFGPKPFTVHTPDARTLVVAVPGQPVVRTDSNAERWGAAWKHVERAGYVVLLDNRSGRWTRSMAEIEDLAPAVAVLGTPLHLAVGLNWGERVSATVAADWEQPPVDADVIRLVGTIHSLIETKLKAETPQDPSECMLHNLLAQMLLSTRVRRDGEVVIVETDTTKRWAELLAVIPLEGKAQAEMKSGGK
jgi:beta-lactamase regulating signal transducer with metallopeptidase domain